MLRFAHARLSFAALGLTALALGTACQSQPDVLTPNRVLDRPTDMAFVCANFDCDAAGNCDVSPVSLADCSDALGSCQAPNDSSDTRLLGIISNSERNELSVAKIGCGELVDLDPDLPGYNFLPAGILPTHMSTGPGSCRTVAANAGSCDLTVVDGAGIAALAFDREAGREASSLVGQLLPSRFDSASQSWVPLGTRVGEVISAPRALSTATPIQDAGANNCASTTALSAFVSFPSCDLIAEVDLNTGNLLQSMQFFEQDDGSVRVVDSGIDPSCPVDCPEQFSDGLPEGTSPGTGQGVSIAAMELVRDETDLEDVAEDYRLYAGGLGSDQLFEMRFGSAGTIQCDSNASCTPQDPGCTCSDVAQVQVLEAKGVERIRSTPRMFVGEGNVEAVETQFMYVIVGDGSTRVLQRDLQDEEVDFATECDTQIEGVDAVVGAASCPPVEVVPEGLKPLGRRHFARGPGIRPPGDVKINDWSFFRVDPDLSTGSDDTVGLPYPCASEDTSEQSSVVVGVGIASNGFLYFTAYPESGFSRALPVVDPVGVMFDAASASTLNLPLHALRQFDQLDVANMPSVSDISPGRTLRDSADLASLLAPTLRLIDYAYSRVDEDGVSNAGALLGITNVDQLGGDPEQPPVDSSGAELGVGFLYENNAPRIIPRDYRSWLGGQWTLDWEGSLPGTGSATGVVRCSGCEEGGDPSVCGWERASCKSQVDGDSRLIDSGAQFCDEGVLAGDKMHMFGCFDDGECGIGQRCLTAAGTTTVEGICIPETDFVDTDERARLREVCAEFIDDPCGTVSRDYLVTKAFQDELWLQALDRPVRSHLRVTSDEEAGTTTLEEVQETYICTATQPENACETDSECQNLLEGTDEDVGGVAFACIEDRCQRPCEGSDECTLRRLPGPECFGEFVRYNVRARNSFTVRGPGGADFFTDHVRLDEDTGECLPTEGNSNISELLRSRIALGPDAENLGLPACPSDTSVGALDPNPCVITTPREGNDSTRFHYVSYQQEPVTAIRYSNPVFSLVFDLVSLNDLGNGIVDLPDAVWPADSASFQRSRIPVNYRVDFALSSGYIPHVELPIFQQSSLAPYFPIRAIPGVGSRNLYVVDASGPGSSSGLRGQVLRGSVCTQFGDVVFALDESFDGIR